MDTVLFILTIALLVFSVLLVVIVMAQNKRGEGLGGAISGQSNFYNNSKKGGKDAFLKKSTAIVSIIILILVIAMNILVYISQKGA